MRRRRAVAAKRETWNYRVTIAPCRLPVAGCRLPRAEIGARFTLVRC